MASSASKKYEIDMCNGPLGSSMMRFALPLMATALLQQMYNAADMVVVGRFAGSDALAAVGSVTRTAMYAPAWVTARVTAEVRNASARWSVWARMMKSDI